MPLIRPQNLNDVFLAGAKQARQKMPELTHNQKAAHLYRQSLRVMLSWAVDRDIFNESASEIRARFDANRGASPAAASRLLQEGSDELFLATHPDMYCVPTMPGGSKFMRNPPPPMIAVFPDGVMPKDAPQHTVNPDMSWSKPETGKAAVGSVLVDFYKKNME